MKSLGVFVAGVMGFVAAGTLGCIIGLAISLPVAGMIAGLSVPLCGMIGSYRGAVTAAQAVGKRVYGQAFSISEPATLLICLLFYLVLILIILAPRMRL
jgi:hypothetical protein